MSHTQETGIPDVLAANTKITKLADGMSFCEGPVWDKKHHRLIFSDTDADEHRCWSDTQGLQTFRKPSYQPNGNVFDLQGRLWTCEHESRAISMTNIDGQRTIVVDNYAGKRFHSPNDLEVKSDETIWFSDPTYGVGNRTKEMDFQGVFRFDPKANKLTLIADDLSMPNGIAFSPDEKKLYVGDSAEDKRQIRAFTVNSDGTVSGGEVLCTTENPVWGPDGVDVDANGNIYTGCGDGVNIFSPAGLLLGKILTEVPISNFAFGGNDGKMLFMTSEHALYRVNLLVAGAVKRW
ncbi:SMP-30/gluconolactonase/LRE family protein [Brasilonema sp. CT11]|nr:SMP-30/gluconolactonase/LRE family protein [Brasilonema sp. CT11]